MSSPPKTGGNLPSTKLIASLKGGKPDGYKTNEGSRRGSRSRKTC